MSDNNNLVFTGGGWVAMEEERPHRAKIIDAHYHIFPKLGSQKKGIDPEVRLRFWQFSFLWLRWPAVEAKTSSNGWAC